MTMMMMMMMMMMRFPVFVNPTIKNNELNANVVSNLYCISKSHHSNLQQV